MEMRTLPMPDAFRDYFNRMAEFVLLTVDAYRYVETGRLYLAPLEELRERNYRLYEDILPENYDKSYGNPAYSVSRLGEDYGRLFSFLCAELRSMIPLAHEKTRRGWRSGWSCLWRSTAPLSASFPKRGRFRT